MVPDPQFGRPEPGKVHRDRPAAFGLALRDARLALVRVSLADRPAFLDLPGGAIDPGEDAAGALVREFGEETGLVVGAGAEVCRASQYFLTGGDDAPVNNRCTFFETLVRDADPSLKVEHDHELVWITPDEALRSVRHDAHAWAIVAWLRQARP